MQNDTQIIGGSDGDTFHRVQFIGWHRYLSYLGNGNGVGDVRMYNVSLD